MRSRREPLGSVQEEKKKSESLEVHLSLPSNEEEKWKIDARRLVVVVWGFDV